MNYGKRQKANSKRLTNSNAGAISPNLSDGCTSRRKTENYARWVFQRWQTAPCRHYISLHWNHWQKLWQTRTPTALELEEAHTMLSGNASTICAEPVPLNGFWRETLRVALTTSAITGCWQISQWTRKCSKSGWNVALWRPKSSFQQRKEPHRAAQYRQSWWTWP